MMGQIRERFTSAQSSADSSSSPAAMAACVWAAAMLGPNGSWPGNELQAMIITCKNREAAVLFLCHCLVEVEDERRGSGIRGEFGAVELRVNGRVTYLQQAPGRFWITAELAQVLGVARGKNVQLGVGRATCEDQTESVGDA